VQDSRLQLSWRPSAGNSQLVSTSDVILLEHVTKDTQKMENELVARLPSVPFSVVNIVRESGEITMTCFMLNYIAVAHNAFKHFAGTTETMLMKSMSILVMVNKQLALFCQKQGIPVEQLKKEKKKRKSN